MLSFAHQKNTSKCKIIPPNKKIIPNITYSRIKAAAIFTYVSPVSLVLAGAINAT